jgi:hypothetical protein
MTGVQPVRLKLWASRSLVIVPSAWTKQLAGRSHHHQMYLVMVAINKEAARLAGEAVGLHPTFARELRLTASGHCSTPTQALLDYGVVRMDRAGLYVYEHMAANSPIARMTNRDGLVVIAHWRRDGSNMRIQIDGGE